jgi:2-polyprenyl-3-methyl-5-hydroxy-6-metoxy-1,4-benzoquinol methylase
MNEKELYEKQYEHVKDKPIDIYSFPFLRKIFKNFDLHREELALNFLDKGDKLLDVGCGRGSLLFKAKQKFNEVYGIDISPSRIEQAKKDAFVKFPENHSIQLSLCNINEKINYTDCTFDAVTLIHILEHVFDPYFVVSEAYRVLKQNGILVANVPNIAYIKQRIKLLLGKLPITSSPYDWSQIGWDGGHLHYFTKRAFCGLLEECGFKILKVKGSGLFAKFRNFYPSLLTGDICVKAQK